MGTIWVFLDVDGVLNCRSTEDITPNGFTGVEDKKIALLADFVHETGAKIVLTSTWKDKDLWLRELHPGAREGGAGMACQSSGASRDF